MDSVIPFFPIILFSSITLIVAIVVYIDAKKHTNSPLLWFFIVLFLPLLIGILLYIIIRSDVLHNKMHCPTCHHEIEKNFIFCPMCHHKLKKTCKNCQAYLEDNHRVCPYCGTPAIKPCTNCGKDLELDYSVCPYCGGQDDIHNQTNLEKNEDPLKKQYKKKTMIFTIVSLISLVILLIVGIYLYSTNKTYLFFPFQYQKSDIFYLEWDEYEKPLRLEFCYLPDDDGDYECYYTTNEKEIEAFYDVFKEVKFINNKRFTGWRRTPNRYEITLRKMDSENEGSHMINLFYEEGTSYGIANNGEFEMTQELIDYIKNKDYEPIDPYN